MPLPGFTAASSLYTTTGRYMAASRPANMMTGGWTIEPQLPRQIKLLQCLQGCQVAGSPDYCTDHCYWNDFFESGGGGGGGNGGGGGGQTCTPGCGTCHTDPDKPGRWKTCFRANCDEYELRCR